MNLRSASLTSAVFFLPCLAVVSAPAAAQVPPHHAVVGTVPDGPGTSGLFYVSLADGSTTRLTGVPAEFEASSGAGGVHALLRRPDGKLIAGNGAAGGGTISLHMLTMAGATVVATTSLVIGTVPSGWSFGVTAVLMPDGKRVLLSTTSSIQGPMSGYRLGIADLDQPTPTLTPIPLQMTLQGNFTYDVAVGRDSTTAYVLTGRGNADARPFRIYMIDLGTGAVALLHTDAQRFPWPIALRGDHEIYTGACDYYGLPPQPTVFQRLDVTGFGQATVTSLGTASATECIWGGPLDEASGLVATPSWNFANQATPTPRALFLADPRTGSVRLLANPPAAGWGAINVVAVHSAMDHYGRTAQEGNLGFRTFPNPGGEPTAGNASFGVTLTAESTPPNALAALLLGLSDADLMVAGARLLVVPALFVAIPVPTPTQPVFVPMPLPNFTPRGSSLFVQWALCTTAGCESSRGIRIVTH